MQPLGKWDSMTGEYEKSRESSDDDRTRVDVIGADKWSRKGNPEMIKGEIITINEGGC